MKSTKASLTETIQYLCRGKVLASETRELASVSRGKIRPGEGEEWLNEQMYVPPLPPTNLRGCHLINVLYHVYVSIRTEDTFSFGEVRGIFLLDAFVRQTSVAAGRLWMDSSDATNFFLTVRYKPKEFGQGDQVANTHRTRDVSSETGGCASWYRALQTGRSLSIDITHLSTLARRQSFRDTGVKSVNVRCGNPRFPVITSRSRSSRYCSLMCLRLFHQTISNNLYR